MKKATNIAVALEEEICSHRLLQSVTREWFDNLERLAIHEKDIALLPVGWGSEGKAPMLKGWPSHPGFTVEQLAAVRGIRSVGARTGIRSGPLLCFDIDGETALELACSLGMEPWAATTWQVHRDTDPWRLKVLFRPTVEQLSQLPLGAEFQGKTLTCTSNGTQKGEALEVFFDGGRQVIVLGKHPSSGGNYFWPEGLGPEALAPAPDAWWQHALKIAAQSQQPHVRDGKPKTRRVNARRLDPCPVCGRNSGGKSGLWCEQTSDGLIFCMPGSTFNADPTGNMRLGAIVNGYALVKRTTRNGCDYLTFAPHRKRRRHHTRPTSYLIAERRRAARG